MLVTLHFGCSLLFSFLLVGSDDGHEELLAAASAVTNTGTLSTPFFFPANQSIFLALI